MGLVRQQFGRPLLTLFGIQLVLLNLLGFFVGFSLLSSFTTGSNMSDVASTSHATAATASQASAATASQAPAASQKASKELWFKGVTVNEKTRILPSIYAVDNGVPQPFTVTEWTNWKENC